MARIRQTGSSFLLLCIVFGGLPDQAGASSSAELSAIQYVDRSDLIFLGQLIEKESFLSEDRRFILTRYRFSVVEPMKGRTSDQETLVEYGGEVNGLGLTVSHGVTYETGREYLVFAARTEDGELRTLDGQIGRLPIIADGAGERHVRLYPGHPLQNSSGEQRTVLPVGELRLVIEALSGRSSQ